MSLGKEIVKVIDIISSLKDRIKECQELNDDDIPHLKRLFKLKLHHFLIFDLLIRTRKEVAIELLIDYYLSSSIDLNRNVKDHVNDLELFFDSIVEVHNEGELINLFRHNLVNKEIFTNERVKEAIGFALDLEESQIKNWLQRNSIG